MRVGWDKIDELDQVEDEFLYAPKQQNKGRLESNEVLDECGEFKGSRQVQSDCTDRLFCSVIIVSPTSDSIVLFTQHSLFSVFIIMIFRIMNFTTHNDFATH